MNEQLYNVSANPHVRDKASTHSIMLDVIIALLPATLFGFWSKGNHQYSNLCCCLCSCRICMEALHAPEDYN
mgnify:CR=1 FL=1